MVSVRCDGHGTGAESDIEENAMVPTKHPIAYLFPGASFARSVHSASCMQPLRVPPEPSEHAYAPESMEGQLKSVGRQLEGRSRSGKSSPFQRCASPRRVSVGTSCVGKSMMCT